MKILIRFLLIVLATLTFAGLSTAQMGMGMRPPSIAGVFNPTVGSGAAYEVVTKNGAKMALDIAVVDKESDGYWIEMSMQAPQANGNNRMPMNGPSYYKELLVRQGDDLIIRRVIMQMPGRPPMDLSSMPHAIESQESKADVRANGQNMGTESVTTPAGTFSCQHWHNAKDGEDYWISEKVTPWQLVKMSGTNKDSVILTKVITGAKTHITETPVSIQEMMQQHMGRPNQ
jgi:hypothetical protein